MGRQTVSDFLVDTNGYCFICLGKASPQFHCSNSHELREEPTTTMPSLYSSVLGLSQYLKMDMSNVFHEKESIPSGILDTVKRSKLKVSLCEQCTKWNRKISGLCRQLEKIETEVTFYLELVQGSLLRANKDDTTDLLYKMGKGASNGGSLEKIRIVKTLRTEAIEKCSRKLKAAHQPRVNVQKLTTNQVYLKRKSGKQAKSSAKSLHSHLIDGDYIKTEGLDTDRYGYFEDEDDDDRQPVESPISEIGNEPEQPNNSEENEDDKRHLTFADNLPVLQNKSSKETSAWREERKKKKEKEVQPPSSSNETVQNTFVTNPETGKFKCTICSAELTRKWHLRGHYESVHLKIKHKCNICGKEFSKKSNYSGHYRTAHVGVRFTCNLCGQCFTVKTRLIEHQQCVHLGKRFQCQFCPMTFAQKCNMTKHVRRSHHRQ